MAHNVENREIAIQLSGIKKMYKLGQIGGGTLQADLQSWWAKRRGKEDPNTKIGQEQRLVGQTFMALNGIDLTVYKGEALGIIGGNGAGKSTMLKLLSQVTAPTEGTIDLYGRVTSMLEVGTGFNGEMTGRENVYMNGAILGMTKAEIDAKMDDIIEFSEVRDFIDTPVKRYSSGMYVKLAFSVAAHLDSEIMIMDEVLAVGDMAFQKKCLEKMKEAAQKEGRTVLYVSHNMNTIRQLCDRCVVLDKGRIVFNGTVEDAIAVYMGMAGSIAKVFVYEERIHTPHVKRSNYFIKSIEVLNLDTSSCVVGGLMQLKLHTNASEVWRDIRFRLEIQSKEGELVGTMLSANPITVIEGESDLLLEIDTSHLMVDRYKMDLVAYQLNEFGAQILVDGVYPGLIVDILERENDVVWLHKWWGHVRLEDIKVSRMDVIKL